MPSSQKTRFSGARLPDCEIRQYSPAQAKSISLVRGVLQQPASGPHSRNPIQIPIDIKRGGSERTLPLRTASPYQGMAQSYGPAECSSRVPGPFNFKSRPTT